MRLLLEEKGFYNHWNHSNTLSLFSTFHIRICFRLQGQTNSRKLNSYKFFFLICIFLTSVFLWFEVELSKSKFIFIYIYIRHQLTSADENQNVKTNANFYKTRYEFDYLASKLDESNVKLSEWKIYDESLLLWSLKEWPIICSRKVIY